MKLLVCLVWATSVVASDSGVVTPEVGLKSSERSLHVRSIPAIHGYSSNVYEIHMQPFTYNVRPLTASAELKSQDADEAKAVRGELMFVQHRPPTGPVLITGNITGLAPGQHGFHVHEFGDQRKGCASAGPHFDPYMQPHGGPIDPYRHVGDLGNILVGEDGVSRVEIWDQMISLSGTHSILGRSIVIHEMKDDYGRGGDTESMTSGNAGARLACGVIGVTEDTMMMPPPMMPPPMMPPPWQHQGSWDTFEPMGPSGPGNMGPWPGHTGPGPGQMGPGPGQMGPGPGQMGPGPGQMGPGPGQMGPGPGQMGPGPGQGPAPGEGQGPETETEPPAPLNVTPEPQSESAPEPEV